MFSITLKFSEISEINGTLLSVWKFSDQKWSTIPEVVTGRSVRQAKLTVPFPKILVSSPVSLISKKNFGRNANGSL